MSGRYARPLSKSNGGAVQRQPAVQMLPLVNAPHMKAGGDWAGNMMGGNKASKVVAKNLALAPGKKFPRRPNQPSVDPSQWKNLWNYNLTHMRGPPNYVRMHFLNGKLGGPGNDTKNLAPGTGSMNQKHSNQVEQKLINALNAGGEVSKYTITANYQPASGNLVTKKAKTAWTYTLASLVCDADYKPKAGAAKVNLKKTITEKVNLDTQKNWKGL